MSFNSKHALDNIEKICNASKFFDTHEHKVREILDNSRKRMDVFASHMGSLGLKINIQEFNPSYQHGLGCTKMKAANCVASYEAGTQELWFTGHHDYCAANGASDNASSLGIMMELARCTIKLKPKITVRFASFDLEENGQLGSWAFVGKWKGLEKIKSLVNMDVVAGGKDLIICRSIGGYKSSKKLCKILKGISSKLNHEMHVRNVQGFSSDHIPFIGRAKKVAEITAGNISSYLNDGNINHTNEDTFENLNINHIEATGSSLLYMIENF
ncbi:MAG: M28 family peptidase [Candidatus Woesearchaeota archaeon]